MKKLLVLFTVLVGLVGLVKPSQAVYTDPITREPISLYFSKCVLTPDPAQKNATTVYTLNIDMARKIESAYLEWWNRAPRCDEVQYHIEHNTTIIKLSSWLSKVEIQRFKDHTYDGLVKTHAQGTYGDAKTWRLINGKRQRVYDWPTQMAWGFVSADLKPINIQLSNEFFAAYPEIAPLKYSDGPYKTQVDTVWKTGATDINAPARLKTELIKFGVEYGFFKYRDACSQFMRGCGTGYDYTFLYTNPCIYNSGSVQCDR
ncbi:MAG: hypothetical protein WC734_03965 [Patescibacteria group bacterium]|jgi:hypothetical protein